MARPRALTVLVSALVPAGPLAGCAAARLARPGSSKPAGSPEPARSATTTSPKAAALPGGATTLPAGSSEPAREADMLLRLSDLPAGWTAKKDGSTAGRQPRDDGYSDHCLGVPVIEGVTTSMAHSQFQRGSLDFVCSDVASFKTADQAGADLSALSGPKAVSSVIATTRRLLRAPPGARIDQIAGQALSRSHGELGQGSPSPCLRGTGRSSSSAQTSSEWGAGAC